jgi:predicted acylesterase/phospholipase RssA
MDIAEAVRTSISLPLVFQPIKDMVTKDVLEDGGVGSNVPAEVFRGQPQEKTLVLGFDNNGRFNDIVSRGKVHQTVGWLPILLSGNLNLQKTSDADAQKLYNAGPNAMDVTHGALNTTSFMASNATIDAAERQAEIRAMETFSLRQHQAVDHVFDSLQDAMKAMTTHELNDIINQYIFTEEGDPLAKKDRDDIRQAAEKELKTRNQPELQFEK